jgi:hypothetical protein
LCFACTTKRGEELYWQTTTKKKKRGEESEIKWRVVEGVRIIEVIFSESFCRIRFGYF